MAPTQRSNHASHRTSVGAALGDEGVGNGGTPFITLNGTPVPLADVDPDVTVLNWIRSQGLTGAKEGCVEGECGACAILVVKPCDVGGGAAGAGPHGDKRSMWTAVNACLVPVGSLAGQEVRTAEGLGTPSDLHPVQREMAVRGGSQCGYCTPGFVCSMAAESTVPGAAPAPATAEQTTTLWPDAQDQQPADHEHGPNGFDLHALSGNLCRCTGYRPIRTPRTRSVAPDADDPLARPAAPAPRPGARIEDRGANGSFVRPRPWPRPWPCCARSRTRRSSPARPTAASRSTCAGCARASSSASTGSRSCASCGSATTRIEIGAAVTLSEAESWLAGRVPLLDALFPQFASRLIRNGATLGGNLGTGSPIGDSPPALLALDANSCSPTPTGSARSTWPTTSPATGRPSAGARTS